MIGQMSQMYEVLNGERKLTTFMVSLHIELGIPAGSLIHQPG